MPTDLNPDTDPDMPPVQSGGVVRVIIADAPPERLDKALARDVPASAALSRTRLSRLIAQGHVQRDGVPVRDAKLRVSVGDAFDITLPAAESVVILPEPIPLTVIYEDDAVIVIDKPSGMVVHPAPGSPSGTLVNALMAHCGDSLSGIGGEKRPGIVHRIDKDTSGLLVAAKTDRAHHGLSEQFAAHSVEREYRALIHGVPEMSDPRLAGLRGVRFEPGGVLCITTRLDRHKTDRQRQAVSFDHGRRAVTRCKVQARYGDPAAAALVNCWLETGRTHQIRVHLAHIGHGLIGDPVYGRQRKLPARALGPAVAAAAEAFPRQALHAAVLGFEHPVTGETLRFSAPLPADFAALLAALSA